MKLHEYQAKELLARYGAPTPRSGGVASTPEEVVAAVEALGGRGVLKAQVHTGGRGKAGGIKVAESPAQARELAQSMLGMLLKTHQSPQGERVLKLLVEEPIQIVQEYYIGIVPDRARQCNVIIASAMGGMDIETVAEEHPEAVVHVAVDPAVGLRDFHARMAVYGAGIPAEHAKAAAAFVKTLYAAYDACDANMAEINPLAVTSDGRLVAADAKMVIDDNALYRHADMEAWKEETEEDPIEAEAHRRGIQYVRLGGDIGVIGNGAGLVMSTLDEVARAGGKAANFLDIGGGARAETVRNSLEVVLLDPNVKGVLFNIFGGITRGDEVAKGILEATSAMDIRVPMVVRLAGTRAAEGRALLEGSPLTPADTMQEAAARIVELAYA